MNLPPHLIPCRKRRSALTAEGVLNLITAIFAVCIVLLTIYEVWHGRMEP